MKQPFLISALWIGVYVAVLFLMPTASKFEPAFRPYEFIAEAATFAFAVGLSLGVNKFRFGKCFPGAGPVTLNERLVRKLGRSRTIFFWAVMALVAVYAVVKGLVLLISR